MSRTNQPTRFEDSARPDEPGTPVSRRTLAKGLAWAAPTVLLSTPAPAPAVAASISDVIVSATPCSKASGTVNIIPFTVQTVHGATIPAGTVFRVDYAGGSRSPTWNGTLAENSNSVYNPKNDWSINGGRYGSITFTLRSPMPANTTWTLNINMDIGAVITGQETRLTLASSLPDQNRVSTNDSAAHSMYLGGCGD